MLEDWYRNNKRRREQRLMFLQRGFSFELSPSISSVSESHQAAVQVDEKMISKKTRSEMRLSKFLRRTLISGLLLASCWSFFNFPFGIAEEVKQDVAQVLYQDLNFDDIAQFYSSYVDRATTILPAFRNSEQGIEGDTFLAPVRGEVLLNFDQNRKGVVIRSLAGASVVASKEGEVIFSGYKEGLGNLVVVRHNNGDETWCGWLEKVIVKVKDKVDKGQQIANVGAMQGQYITYIALKSSGSFINPMGKILFE